MFDTGDTAQCVRTHGTILDYTRHISTKEMRNIYQLNALIYINFRLTIGLNGRLFLISKYYLITFSQA